ncbi:MAG TPA: phosphoribosylaminoimidazolesuccinocarboxamide synthase [Acidothermaceae bacterium]|nr:phosphoribosylaminoimidazolesuccinocarboxamide synthase [Acidothermaceae bacterium]
MSDYTFIASGKVRDLYEMDDGSLLFVASDRISAYDFVLPTPIPDKGAVLTAMSIWWFEQLADVVPNHLISTDVPPEFAGRAMICERLDMLPVECIARGYLTGSGLSDYKRTGAVSGIPLPAGLVDGSRLPQPLFTPSTKAPIGEHDENISLADVEDTIGADAADELKRLTLAAYGRAEEIARARGIILADTKFEFGRRGAGAASSGEIVLADEVLTPDSSRFWPADLYEPGHAQPSYDKQYVRDWLTSPASGWDRSSDAPPPPLPDEVVAKTREKYIEAYERLTGLTWS